jgi:hypothetical protein
MNTLSVHTSQWLASSISYGVLIFLLSSHLIALQEEVTQDRKAITVECKKTEREGEWLEIVPHRHTRHCDIRIFIPYFNEEGTPE